MTSERIPSESQRDGEQEFVVGLDVPAARSLLGCFSGLTCMPAAITDLSGNVLVATGWQDACMRFHRAHPVTSQICIESDLHLADGLVKGEFRALKCPNGLWDMATPLYVGGVLCGRVHVGQFLYEDESMDLDFFRAQAERYGFARDEYLSAVEGVPRYSRERAHFLMRHLTDAVEVVSRLSLNNHDLATAEARYRELYERSPVGYQSLDVDGRLLDVNQSWLEMLGYSREEVIGHWFGDFLAPHMVELFRERFPRFRAAGKTSTEFEMKRKDGEIITVAFDGRIGYRENGEFSRTHCVLTNVTEHRRAEELLQRTQFAVDHAADCVYWISPEGRLLYVNDSACNRLGYSRDELLALSLWDINPGLRPEDRAEQWAQIKAAGSATFEREHQTKTGEIFPVEIRANYFEYGGREFNFASVRDSSERRNGGRRRGRRISRISTNSSSTKSTMASG